MKVFTFGAPGRVGGASTEIAHTIALWAANGIEVHVLPTWGSGRPVPHATVHTATEETFPDVPGLAGSIVVSFCSAPFLKHYGKLKEMGCKLVWLNCMTWPFDAEKIGFAHYGCPDALIFQSDYQRQKLEPVYREYGYDPASGHLIRGAFDVNGWPFAPRPHEPGGDFVLGKLARADCDKWSSNLWKIYGQVQYSRRNAFVKGMDERVAKKLGNLPDWAEWLSEKAELPAQEYFARIHCMLTVNGGAAENWPRVGLEAFACGVPVVAQREWGWTEMVEDGVTGYLGGSDEELAHWAAVLAWDEPLRLRMVRRARERLVDELAHPQTLWAAWERVFASVVTPKTKAA